MEVNCAHKELKDIDFLIPNPKNANQHPKEQIELLAKLMKFQGWRHPVIVSNRSGFVVAGHGRIEAAKLNGWKDIPVDYQDFENEAQEYAFLVSDNKIQELAETDMNKVFDEATKLPDDFDLDLLGIPDFELPNIFEPQADEDAVPEHVEPKTKLGDLYQLGEHRLLCGDSTSIDAVEKLMDGERADMVFTDPPYNINYNPDIRPIGERARSQNKLGTIDNDEMSDENFLDFLRGINASILAVTAPGGAIYQCAPIGMNNLYYLTAWKESGFHYSDGLVWLKNNHSISRKDYHPKHEIIHYGWTQGSHKWFGGRDKFSVYEASRENVQDYKHPTQKPVTIPEHFVLNSSEDGARVLDLFGGSGSTLIACEKTNRKCFMMELDPHYCDVIVARWEKYTGKKAELTNE